MESEHKDPTGNSTKLLVYVSWAQALYYVLTGVWSLVSIRTFQMVTGPKTDTWLVKTVGTLVIVIGAVLGMAGSRREWSPEVPALAVGRAAGLAGIDVVYVTLRRISPVYLIDAAAEVFLILAWVFAVFR